MKHSLVAALALASAIASAQSFTLQQGNTRSAFRDVSGLEIAQATYAVGYSRESSDPAQYVNEARVIGGTNWNENLRSYLSAYGPLGLELTGDLVEGFGLYGSGAVDSSVSAGVYDFSLELRGGQTDTSDDVLFSASLVLEVAENLSVNVGGYFTDPTVAPGESSVARMRVTNTGSRTLVSSTWFLGLVPPGATDSIFNVMDVNFANDEPWFGIEVGSGQTVTRNHSIATARSNTPNGTYSLYGGWVGGLHEGDYHYARMTPAPQLQAVPEPGTLSILGLALAGFVLRRRRSS